MKCHRILALTDLSSHSIAGVTLANRLAQRCGARVTVGFAHTDTVGLARYSGSDPENVERLASWVRSEDDNHLHELARRNVDPLRIGEVIMIDAAGARAGVDALVARTKPDLVCMATHGRSGIKHLLLGSVAEHALRSAGVPVLVTREQQLPPVGEPLVVHLAVDLMSDPTPIARDVAGLMKPDDELHLVHVVESAYVAPALYGPEAVLAQPDVGALQRAAHAQLENVALEGDAPALTFEIRNGRPRDEIVHAAKDRQPSIVALRTHGRTGFDRLMLGSVAEFVARRCPHPVLVLPPAQLTS